MKKLITILFIAGTAGALFYLTTPNKQKGAVHIALFTPTTHPALEEIALGFEETLQRLTPRNFIIIPFNANGNKSLLRAQAEEIVSGRYDLIFTIGASCSQMISELSQKRKMQMPQVFTAIDSLEFAQRLRASGLATGVYLELNYLGEMDMLHQLKPTAKKLLLVYDPSQGTGLEKFKLQIANYITKYGMSLDAVEVYQASEIQAKVTARLAEADVLLVLVDNTVVAGIDALIALCNRYGVTLLASDLASGQKGAALAYGVTEYESGKAAAYKAHEILVNAKQPANIPLEALANFRTAINRDTMQLQNLVVSEETLKSLGETNHV